MDYIAWGAIIGTVTLLVVLGGVIVRLMDRINKAEGAAATAFARADTAAISVSANKLEIERVENDLVDHRVAVAKDYVSKSTLESLETRIVDAINRLGDRLDKLLAVRTA